MPNFSCSFDCGLFHKLRDECTGSCGHAAGSCTAHFPLLSNVSQAFQTQCEGWCCEPLYELTIGFLCVVGAVVVLCAVVTALCIRRCLAEREAEEVMRKATWQPSAARREAELRYAPEEVEVIPADDTVDEGGRHHHHHHTADYQFPLEVGVEDALPSFRSRGSYTGAGAADMRRSTINFDGEISIGFADLDEADRADGVSVAGSLASRRLSQRGSAQIHVIRDDALLLTSSQMQSLNSSPRGVGAPTIALDPEALRLVQGHHIASSAQSVGTPGGTSLDLPSGRHRLSDGANSTYVGVGGGTLRPTSSQRRQGAAVSWNPFTEEIDVAPSSPPPHGSGGSTVQRLLGPQGPLPATPSDLGFLDPSTNDVTNIDGVIDIEELM